MRIPQYKEKATPDYWKKFWKAIDLDEFLKVAPKREPFKIILSNIKKSDKILEAGCGIGKNVIMFDKMGYNIEGVDFSSYAIKRIKEYYKKAKVKVMDVRKLKYKDETFDVYMTFGVVEHFPEGPDKILKEANRVLKPGGKMILTVPYMNLYRRMLYPVLRFTNWRRKKQGAEFYQYLNSRAEILRFIRRNGFKIESFYPYDAIDKRSKNHPLRWVFSHTCIVIATKK